MHFHITPPSLDHWIKGFHHGRRKSSMRYHTTNLTMPPIRNRRPPDLPRSWVSPRVASAPPHLHCSMTPSYLHHQGRAIGTGTTPPRTLTCLDWPTPPCPRSAGPRADRRHRSSSSATPSGRIPTKSTCDVKQWLRCQKYMRCRGSAAWTGVVPPCPRTVVLFVDPRPRAGLSLGCDAKASSGSPRHRWERCRGASRHCAL